MAEIQILAAFVGGLGFSIVFGIRRRIIWLIALNAGISWAICLAVTSLLGDFAGNLAAAVFCSLFSAVSARFVDVPSAVLQMPATVPMIPGGSLYYTMYYAITGNGLLFKSYLLSTLEVIFAMAIGFAFVAVFLGTYGRALTAVAERLRKR